MSDPADIIKTAIDAVFATFGRAAQYRPPPNGATSNDSAIACTVLMDRTDGEASYGESRVIREGKVFEVRKAEVAQPDKGGEFVVGGETFAIIAAPRCDDPERLVWICTVS